MSNEETKVSENIETSETADAVETSEVVETTESAEAVETTGNAEATEAVETTENAEATEAVETTENAEATEAVETTESAEATEAVETTESAEAAEAVETTESAETSETVETTQEGNAPSDKKKISLSTILIIASGVVLVAAAVIIIITLAGKKEFVGANWYDGETNIDSEVARQDAFGGTDVGTSSIASSWAYGLPDEGYLANDGSFYYVSNPIDDYKIYQIEMNKPYGNKKLCDMPGDDINVVDGKVYFINSYEKYGDEIGIYSINTDGSNLECIAVGTFYDLTVVNDWLYFIDVNLNLKKMNIANRRIVELPGENFSNFIIHENTIFYELHIDKEDDKSYWLREMDVDGNNQEEIAEQGKYRSLIYKDGYLYYTITDERIGRINIESKQDETLYEQGDIAGNGILGENLYFRNKSEEKVKCLNLGDNSVKTINLEKTTGYSLAKDLIILYYTQNGEPLISVNDLNSGAAVSFFEKEV